MLQLDELRLELQGYEKDINDIGHALDIDRIKNEVVQLEQQAVQSDFWDNMDQAQEILKRTSNLKSKILVFEQMKSRFEDAITLIELAVEDGQPDEKLLAECSQNAEAVKKEIETQRLATLLSGEYDANNAILTFHAGAGGTEAQDWAEMLYRMYTHWAERGGFSYTVLDYLDGDEAGLKSASIIVKGLNAYGYLKCEAGVHRLVRVSPFDSSGRRHTSFAALEVVPEIDDSVEIDIRPDDLKVDTYRSGGAGGQHVNKTESAIRITHIPSGIVVACQNERSQHQNREVAMKMLKSKLIEIKEREHLDKIEDIKGGQSQIAWGSQIRSYVFMPYTMVKDHRTSFEVGNIDAVMDGDLDGFINAYLKAAANNSLDS